MNLQSSRSRILDTDNAKETTTLAKSQIIAQAATAMLAQANQSGQWPARAGVAQVGVSSVIYPDHAPGADSKGHRLRWPFAWARSAAIYPDPVIGEFLLQFLTIWISMLAWGGAIGER